MSRQNLTDRFIKSRKPAPAGKRVDYPDSIVPGLALRVTDHGHKSFVLVARYQSKNPTRRVLGNYGAMTLERARNEARTWLEMIGKGKDPKVEARKHRVEAEQRVTFDVLRAAYLKAFSTKKKHGEATRILHREFKAWEDRYADEIDAGDVEAAIRVIVDRGALAQARNAFGYVRAMYGWAIGLPSMRIKVNPCDSIKIVSLAGVKKSRDRWFGDEEIRLMWSAADDLGAPSGAVIKLLFLTAKRLNEVAHLSWSEIDDEFAKNEIIIPGRRMKGEDAPDHLQPLTPLMREILDGIHRHNGGDFVFSTTGGRLPMTIGSKVKAKISAAMPGAAQWGWHDIRRTARTNFSKLPIPEQVREAMLSHTKKGLDKVYNLYDYADEKRDAYMLWESQLRKILNPPPAIAEPPPPVVTNLAEERRRLRAEA